MAEVSKNVKHLVIVLNKADRTTDVERGTALKFTARMLAEKIGVAPSAIYEVSALEQLRSGDANRDWKAFVRALEDLSCKSGRALIHSAMTRGMAHPATLEHPGAATSVASTD